MDLDMLNAGKLRVVIVGPDEALRKHGDVSTRINRKRTTWDAMGMIDDDGSIPTNE